MHKKYKKIVDASFLLVYNVYLSRVLNLSAPKKKKKKIKIIMHVWIWLKGDPRKNIQINPQ